MEDTALAGKVAIVTGSSRGIGYAIAEALVGAGIRVVVSGRDRARRGGRPPPEPGSRRGDRGALRRAARRRRRELVRGRWRRSAAWIFS